VVKPLHHSSKRGEEILPRGRAALLVNATKTIDSLNFTAFSSPRATSATEPGKPFQEEYFYRKIGQFSFHGDGAADKNRLSRPPCEASVWLRARTRVSLHIAYNES
jgi:hypothetical protein